MGGKIDKQGLSLRFREIAESLGCEYVGTEFSRSRSGLVVRVYIDSPEGIGHARCEDVSRRIASFLDEAEEADLPLVGGSYFIEVSSPGLERPLFSPEHYRRFTGKRVAIRTKTRRKIVGDIIASDEESVGVSLPDGSEERVAYADIEAANLVFIMEKGEKKVRRKK